MPAQEARETTARGPRSAVVVRALELITRRTNLSTGLAHLGDRNAVKEMFLLLYRADEWLSGPEIQAWARGHGWDETGAGELAVMGDDIGQGRRICIRGGPYWTEEGEEPEEVVKRLRAGVKRRRTPRRRGRASAAAAGGGERG